MLRTHIWWDDSKARNRVLYIRFGVMTFFWPIHCSLINRENWKSQFHESFLRSSENSRFAWNIHTARENGVRLGFGIWLHSVALSTYCSSYKLTGKNSPVSYSFIIVLITLILKLNHTIFYSWSILRALAQRKIFVFSSNNCGLN